ncbi:flagellar hook-associated protein FlgL [Sulfuricurvum sp.]|uniref:flagellar hook-associated protein FlgL n=1 Tax=Sulfuricurvum sp. TaxID=2025608 RepID=UPI00261FD88A|nr:flagellar hook-associated protein FlgL [Sulfuricurvum sp.]MDD2780026.1 flagellar hook-associated protein FlgL [Sulfuricurvum sp.]
MRITSGSYYNNIYGENNRLNKQLFDVNKQISSGLKIQYAHEDPGVFIDTLRLDDELTTLNQVKSSAQSAYKMSTQTDTTIGEIVKTLESMKVKMVNAANDAHSDTSIQAIAKELRGLQNHLLTLANTSIGGQYLFSGTATSVKPIGNDGTYQGNSENLEAFLGSGIKQKYNISGSQLFLGDETKTNRTISANVAQKSLTDLYPDIMKDTEIPRSDAKETYITGSSTLRDLMGDTDVDTTNDQTPHFYIQGTKSDGTTFKSHINSLTMNSSMDDLLQEISDLYGNNQVEVSLNTHGQIEIIDKKTGSSKLDFHMVGAVDFSGGTAAADAVNDINTLRAGSTDFENIIDGSNSLYVKEFTKSGFDPSDPLNTIEGVNYDQTFFEKKGSTLFSNMSQIVKSDNTYATPSTKIVDVGSFSTNTIIHLEGTTINGAPFSTDIDLASDLLDENGNPTAINDATYQQLMDAINMIVTGEPTIEDSYLHGKTSLTYDGKIIFEDKDNPATNAALAIYDASSSNYTLTNGSALTFNANNALTIRDPKTDFFTEIEEMIQAVEQGKKRSDGTDNNDPRNLGIQNAIQMMDDLSDHVSRLQTETGSYSQVLQASSDRTDMLIISTKTLQSDVIDTDIAEATLRMQQLSLNYQALLSNISKVSKLSLVNYL